MDLRPRPVPSPDCRHGGTPNRDRVEPMATPRRRISHHPQNGQQIPLLLLGIAWLLVLVFLVSSRGLRGGGGAALVIVAALSATLFVHRWVERRRWSEPIQDLVSQLSLLSEDPSQPFEFTTSPDLVDLTCALSGLRTSWLEATRLGTSAAYYREVIAGGGTEV